MKREDWQKVYTPKDNRLELRVKYTLASLGREPERSMSMKKVLTLAMVAAMALTVCGVGASGLFAAQYDPVRVANAALAETYGITDEMQTYFSREVIVKDNVTSIIFSSMEDMSHVLGQYVVTIEDGDVAVRWSHDGQSTEGGLDAKAWGAQQIEILLEMTKEDNGYARGYRKAQEIKAALEDGEITVSITDGKGKAYVTTAPLAETDASICISEAECIAIAKEAFSQEFGLTQEQIGMMVYNEDYAGYTYAVKDGKPVCELYFWLHQQEEVYHTEGDGLYRAVIDAQDGKVLDVMYDSALAGNG